MDILGRKLKDNDLVIGMIISRDSDGMRYGVINGKSIHWDNGIKSVCCNLYLIEHPNEKELEIKEKILKEIHEHEQAKKKVKEIKLFKVGHIYKTLNGLEFAYLGKGKVTDIKGNTKEGYIYYYICEYSPLKKIESRHFDNNEWFYTDYISCLKSKKKLYEDTGEIIEIKDKHVILTGRHIKDRKFWNHSDKEMKMEVELYD